MHLVGSFIQSMKHQVCLKCLCTPTRLSYLRRTESQSSISTHCTSSLELYEFTIVTCHDSSSYSPASHQRGPGSITGQSVWDLWLAKWHRDKFFSQHFGFPMSVSLHQCSTFLSSLNNTI